MKKSRSFADFVLEAAEEVSRMREAEELLMSLYLGIDGRTMTVPRELYREMHVFLGFDRYEDE